MTAALPQPETFFPFPIPPSVRKPFSGTHAYLAGNSPPGLPPLVAYQLPGLPIGNPHIALEIAADVRPTCFRSRSTGKERDSESGLDYFGARYYGSALGRFTSPDWSAKPQAVPYADFGNPQTLNQYAYVLNNPLAHPDADGHCCEDAANFGEQLVAVPNPYLKAAGYVVIGAAALGTAMTNPEFRKTAGDIMANAGGGGGQYGDFSKQLKIDTAGQNVTNAKTNGPSNADFVVTPGGTSVPVSQGEMEKGFTQAGFPSQPNTQTSEGGTIYDVPTSAGTNMPVRVMPGSATNGTRVVMGTKQSPRTADGVRPEQGKEKDESHIEQRP